MFDGEHLFIPAPPPCLSAAASNAQTVAMNRHLENLNAPSSYVQFTKPDFSLSARSPRPTTAPALKQIRSVEPTKLIYEPASKIESLAVALDLSSRVSEQRRNEECESHQSRTSNRDVGRDRAMCSSPREQLSAAARESVLNHVQQRQDFTNSLAKEASKIREVLSPRKETAATESMTTPPVEVADIAVLQSKSSDQESQAVSATPRRPMTSSFASRSKRFESKPEKNPPVGHYNARFTIVEHSPRASILRDPRSRGGPFEVQKPYTDENCQESVVDSIDSARQRAKARAAATQPTEQRPTSTFVSAVPQLYFHELYQKTHPSLAVEVANADALPVTQNLTACSTVTRPTAPNLYQQTGRDFKVFEHPSSAPKDIVTYREPETTLNAEASGNVTFQLVSPRKNMLWVQPARVTYVEEAVDLHKSTRTVKSPRVVSVPQLARQTPRNQPCSQITRDLSIPTTVSVELVADRSNLHRATEPHVAEHRFNQQVTYAATHTLTQSAQAAPTTEMPFEEVTAQPFSRPPEVLFTLASSHQDVKSFAKIADLRIAHGDVPSTDIDPPSIEVTRPKFIQKVKIGAAKTKPRTVPQKIHPVAVESIIESPQQSKRVIGNPHMALATTREQRNRACGRSAASQPVDKFYDVAYVTESQKIKLLAQFEKQVERLKARGGRADAELVNRDDVPGPGSYV